MSSDRTRAKHDTQWVEVDRNAILRNHRFFSDLCRPATVMPIIKGNAYGHGMPEVAEILAKEMMWGFGVANLEEAISLRATGISQRILVLSYYEVSALQQRIMRGIALVVHDAQNARALQQKVKSLGVAVPIHLKLDSGATRIGVLPKNIPSLMRLIRSLPNLRLEGVFSHFSDAESASATRTKEQLELFLNTTKPLAERGILRHIACTAAILRYPESRLDVGRLGIGLYGIWPSRATRLHALGKRRQDFLRPALMWKTRIEQVKTVPKGTRIGYSGTFRTRQTTKVAVVPVGYADGYDRRFSNCGMMLAGGRRCRVIGRVSMNMTMIDCTGVRTVRAGDTAVIIGRQGRDELSAWEVSKSISAIPYELLARISPTIPRVVT